MISSFRSIKREEPASRLSLSKCASSTWNSKMSTSRLLSLISKIALSLKPIGSSASLVMPRCPASLGVNASIERPRKDSTASTSSWFCRKQTASSELHGGAQQLARGPVLSDRPPRPILDRHDLGDRYPARGRVDVPERRRQAGGIHLLHEQPGVPVDEFHLHGVPPCIPSRIAKRAGISARSSASYGVPRTS